MAYRKVWSFTRWPMVLASPFDYYLSLVLFLAHSGRWPYGRTSLDSASVISLPDAWINQPAKDDEDNSEGRNWKPFFALLRGTLLALPVILFFATLLSAADPVFEQAIRDFLEFFNLEDLVEYIFRGVYIFFLAYILAGVYLFAFYKSKPEKLVGDNKDWRPNFLGFTEGSVVLGSVDILFAAFVAIQFRYFFGGQANINNAGYTFAEYARRGFGELVAVAVFSLFLFLLLNAITKRQAGSQRGWFSTLSIVLVALVGVMLVSAFQRLYLYEQAFGFSRLRTYSHTFMIWLGVLSGGGCTFGAAAPPALLRPG